MDKLNKIEQQIRLFKKYYGGNTMEYETKQKIKYGVIGAICMVIIGLFLKKNKNTEKMIEKAWSKLEGLLNKND